MNVRDTIKNLPDEKRTVLMKFFDTCESYVMELEDGSFIGCHMVNFDGLEVIEQLGCWTVGRRIQ